MPALLAHAQPKVVGEKAYNIDDYVPAGNYSGIAPLGNGRYAVVDDKHATDGFYVWQLALDSLSGELLSLRNEGFRGSDSPNRDAEGVAVMKFHAMRQTDDGAVGSVVQRVAVCGERDNRIVEYTPEGQLTGRKSENLLGRTKSNAGLEGLCWDATRQCLWAMEEKGKDGLCHLFQVDSDLVKTREMTYLPDFTTRPERGKWQAHGVSGIAAAPNGGLLVLEREVWVPEHKVGAWVKCKIYYIDPADLDRGNTVKQLVWQNQTHINFLSRSWANYEGLCWGPRLANGTRTLLLVSDSQDRYSGFLHDWLLVLQVEGL